ncbi:MAG: metallophosphoesterase [Myxococcota bacterium]|jgi:Icc-related predicted phosphoesterase|nr:metallophosphoesterase [Myxococcota bacterium]
MAFTVALISDTHVRVEPVDSESAYPSDALQNDRLRRVVTLAESRSPALAIHLGDLTHTVPGLPTHEAAVAKASEILGALGCPLHVVPGNHDVGDKPGIGVTAPSAADPAHRALHERTWGPAWRSVVHQGVHLVLLDGTILNTPLETEQRVWLEAELKGAGRIFLFVHYPPFIHRADEPPHYDNLAEPGRSWLLDLVARHPVEAVLSGHVHHYFHNRHGGAHLYVLPSTAFTRPAFGELFPVGPAPENGRNDEDKLGFCLLHVHEKGHELEFVRSNTASCPPTPPAPSRLGAWLTGGWARSVDLPHGGLDPFTRKTARNDYPILTLRELGMSRIRLPLSDLDVPGILDRVLLLADLGIRATVFSPGAPTHEQREQVARHGDLLETWEIVAPPESLDGIVLEGVTTPVALSSWSDRDEGGRHSHFPLFGFSPNEPLPALPVGVDFAVFRITADPFEAIGRAGERARARGVRAVCHVEIPRHSEQLPQQDDARVARFVAETALAAAACPGVRIFVDTLDDRDRGYFPRHGLVDRRWNPRAAAKVLRRLAPLLTEGSPERQGRAWRVRGGQLHLEPEGPGPWLNLETGAEQVAPPRVPALWLGEGR